MPVVTPGERLEAQRARVIALVERHPRLERGYLLAREVVAEQGRYRLGLSAAGSAFWLVLAVFPAVVAVITVFGLVVDPADLAGDVEEITRKSPNSFGALVATQAEQVAGADAGSLSVGLVVSLAVTLWSVSSGGYALSRAVRQAYDLPPQNYVVARARAFIAAVLAVLILGLGVAGTAFVIRWGSTATDEVRMLLGVFGVLAAIVGFAAVVAFTFRFSIAAPTPLRSLLPGVLIGTATTAAVFVGATLLGSALFNYQAVYGALSGIVVALLAFYTIMYIVLLSAVLNQQLAPLATAGSTTGSPLRPSPVPPGE